MTTIKSNPKLESVWALTEYWPGVLHLTDTIFVADRIRTHDWTMYVFINFKIRPPARPPPRPPAPANGKEQGSVTNVPEKKQAKGQKEKRKQKKKSVGSLTYLTVSFP